VKKDSSESTQEAQEDGQETSETAAAAKKAGETESEATKTANPQDAQLLAELKKLVAEEKFDKEVEVAVSSRGVVIRVRENVMFRRGTDRIIDVAFPFLNEIAALLRRFDYDVTVEGHTDDRPGGRTRRFPSNWELSAGRAIAVMRYLAEVGGVDPRRMGAAGYADMRPVATNDTKAGRRKNRRVEFLCHRHPSLSRPQILTSGVAPAPK
ncbi:MAG: flagellar motor protein MotB, partial [Myxococcota bacterium]